MNAINWMKNHKLITAGAVVAFITINGVANAVDAVNKETVTVEVAAKEERKPTPQPNSREISVRYCQSVIDVIKDTDYLLLLDRYIARADNRDIVGATTSANMLADEALLVSKNLRDLERDPYVENAVADAADALADTYADMGRSRIRLFNSDDVDDLGVIFDANTEAMSDFGDACVATKSA